MGMLVSLDVTILNKYWYVTRASVTFIPKVEASVGNTKIMASSLNSHLCSSKTFGYCILQIAYSISVIWNNVRKRTSLGWLQITWNVWRHCTAAVILVANCFLVKARRGWTRWGRSVGCWTPPVLKLKQKQWKVKEASVFARSQDSWESNAAVGFNVKYDIETWEKQLPHRNLTKQQFFLIFQSSRWCGGFALLKEGITPYIFIYYLLITYFIIY